MPPGDTKDRTQELCLAHGSGHCSSLALADPVPRIVQTLTPDGRHAPTGIGLGILNFGMDGTLTTVLDRDLLLSVQELPIVVKQRRAFLHRHFRESLRSALEIGALNTPTIRPGECQTWFMDWFHTDELVAKHADNPKVEIHDIVAVDYVIKSRDFAHHVDREVDMVIANHVIEHIPDPIHWLSEVSRLVTRNGHLLLAVPDRRYTFDYFRRESDAVEMLMANEERRERATAGDIARHLYFFTDVTHTEIWETGPPVRFVPNMSLNDALDEAQVVSQEYTDVHCWVFTTESFLRTFDSLRSSGHVEWEIEAFEGVQPGQNEMRLLLRRP